MEPNQVQSDQGEKPWRYQDGRRRKVGNVKRVEKRRINQDWDYLQKEQLPNNAPSDKIFNASYQNQGLQPQNLNAPTGVTEDEDVINPPQSEYRSRFSRTKANSPQNTNQIQEKAPHYGTSSKHSLSIKPKNDTTPSLAKKGLARVRLTAVNATVYSVGTFIYIFIQLPLAILCFISFTAMVALEGDVGWKARFAAWFYDAQEVVTPLFAVTSITLHLLGLLVLVLLYLAYRSIGIKPLSGNKLVLKQAVFGIVLLFYSIPLLNLLPWGLLVTLVVSLYPE